MSEPPVLSYNNGLKTAPTDAYSDDSYDILIDNFFSYSRHGTCHCVVCAGRREAQNDRKKKKREEKRKLKAKKEEKWRKKKAEIPRIKIHFSRLLVS